jgi:hypothetical protein
MPEGAVPQRRTTKRAIAERRTDVLGFGHVHAAEVAFGKHDALGTKPAQIVVAEVMAGEFLVGPDGFVIHAVSRAAA